MIKRIRKTINWLTKNYTEDDETQNMKTTDESDTHNFITPSKDNFQEASTRECFDTPTDFEVSEACPPNHQDLPI